MPEEAYSAPQSGLGSNLPKFGGVYTMNIIQSTDAPVTMSSRDIAELTGKQHKNVLSDIRKMLEALGKRSADFSANVLDVCGRLQEVFNLPKRETFILISGYSVELRARIIDRWQELEAQVGSNVAFMVPKTLPEVALSSNPQWGKNTSPTASDARARSRCTVSASETVTSSSRNSLHWWTCKRQSDNEPARVAAIPVEWPNLHPLALSATFRLPYPYQHLCGKTQGQFACFLVPASTSAYALLISTPPRRAPYRPRRQNLRASRKHESFNPFCDHTSSCSIKLRFHTRCLCRCGRASRRRPNHRRRSQRSEWRTHNFRSGLNLPRQVSRLVELHSRFSCFMHGWSKRLRLDDKAAN